MLHTVISVAGSIVIFGLVIYCILEAGAPDVTPVHDDMEPWVSDREWLTKKVGRK